MSVLDLVGKAARVAGAGFQGLAEDQQVNVRNVLAQRKAEEEARRNAVLNALTQREIDTPRLGDSNYARAHSEVAGADALATIPAEVQKATALQPIQVGTHEKERKIDVANPLPVQAQPSFTFTTGEDASGKPVILAGNNKTGTLTPTGVNAKSPVTKIESATNTAAKARLKAAISEMNNADAGMGAFEKGLSDGTINISGASQLLGRAANAFTHDDPLSQTIQATTLTTLNHMNPELARYIRRALSFAEAESMISQRPSDFRTKMAAFLSAASSGASPDMIADIQSRRHSILTPLNEVNMEDPVHSSSGGSGSTGTATRAQQLWDAAVKLHGQAKVLQDYGPRPNE